MLFQNHKRYILFGCFFCFCIMSCKIINETGMVFYEYMPKSRIWFENREVDISNMRYMENREAYVEFFIDPFTRKIWVWNHQEDNQYLFVADITSGIYEHNKELKVEIFIKKHPVRIIAYNEIAVVEYGLDNTFYGFIDLKTGKQYVIDLEQLFDGSGVFFYLLGYDGERLVFNEGYYDIEKQEYYKYPAEMRYAYLDANSSKVMGFDEKSKFLSEYDLNTSSYCIIERERKGFDFEDIADRYVDNGEIFIALATFHIDLVPGGAIPRKWYRYDLATGKKTRIFSPSRNARILGRR